MNTKNNQVQFQSPMSSKGFTKIEKAFYQDQYSCLVGGKITGIVILEDHYYGKTTVLCVEHNGKLFQIDVLSDEEGNGAGYAQVTKLKSKN